MPTSIIMEIIKERLGDKINQYQIPPPVFISMRGEFLKYDPINQVLTTQFPVLKSHLNPYGTMQGGMVAAAIDNTLGPLSMLVAPPNVTRRLELKYSRPVTIETKHITVTARFMERKKSWLFFSAEVHDPHGKLLTRAKASHWIINNL